MGILRIPSLLLLNLARLSLCTKARSLLSLPRPPTHGLAFKLIKAQFSFYLTKKTNKVDGLPLLLMFL